MDEDGVGVANHVGGAEKGVGKAVGVVVLESRLHGGQLDEKLFIKLFAYKIKGKRLCCWLGCLPVDVL